jgi:thiamine-phosphate pyrophosphorylase
VTLPAPTLLLITDQQACPNLESGVAAALAGGVKHLLLREKNRHGDHTLREWAEKLYPLVRQHQAQLLISGDIELALSFAGVGLHLPEAAMTTAQARQLLGAKRLLGRSCHDLAGALQAMDQGADYVTLSPLFATRSHPQATPIGPERFARLRAAIPGPVLALGGIDSGNISIALQAGADGVALIRGILSQPSPKEASRFILKIVEKQIAKKTGNFEKR